MGAELTGRVALVTGGSRGIGAAIAQRLAAEGAAVSITFSKSPEKAAEVVDAINGNGGNAIAIKADATDESAVRSAVNETVVRLGGLDILVNNAGIGGGRPIDEMKIEYLDRLYAVNVRSLYIATQEASKHLKAGGRIINIGSCTADRMPAIGGAPYAMTKAAVAAMTRGLAREFASRQITVNNIQPGPIDTDLNPKDGKLSASLLPQIPLGHYGTPDDVASLVAYLARSESAFITGASLSVDGGINT